MNELVLINRSLSTSPHKGLGVEGGGGERCKRLHNNIMNYEEQAAIT